MDSEIYKRRFLRLKAMAQASGYHIRLVPKDRMKDYIGMNYYAARMMGFPFKDKMGIMIRESLSYKDKYETLRHEIDEIELMRKGDSYWVAHKKALSDEHHKRLPHINNNHNPNHHVIMANIH